MSDSLSSEEIFFAYYGMEQRVFISPQICFSSSPLRRRARASGRCKAWDGLVGICGRGKLNSSARLSSRHQPWSWRNAEHGNPIESWLISFSIVICSESVRPLAHPLVAIVTCKFKHLDIYSNWLYQKRDLLASDIKSSSPSSRFVWANQVRARAGDNKSNYLWIFGALIGRGLIHRFFTASIDLFTILAQCFGWVFSAYLQTQPDAPGPIDSRRMLWRGMTQSVGLVRRFHSSQFSTFVGWMGFFSLFSFSFFSALMWRCVAVYWAYLYDFALGPTRARLLRHLFID